VPTQKPIELKRFYVDKLFHGSPQQLVAQLVEDEKLSAQDLKRLRALLSAHGKKSGGTKA